MTKTNKRAVPVPHLKRRQRRQPMTACLCRIGVMALVVLSVSRFAPAQCDSCNGRCNYCVDNQCYPRRLTFGHWETQWRRWPVAPPAPGIPDTPSPTEILDTDLPPAEEESSPNPDFSQRLKKASRPPAVEAPLDIDEPSPLKPDPFRDDVPDSSRQLRRDKFGASHAQATHANFAYRYDNPLRGAVPPEPQAPAVHASYDKKAVQAVRSVPRHANPLRGQ